MKTVYQIINFFDPRILKSRANYRRDESEYALKTKHLLPNILDKLRKQDKPYIVENVRNEKLFHKHKMYDKADFVYFVGRHTYWTNIPFNPIGISQENDNIENISSKDRQGGKNVHRVLEHWLEVIHEKDST